MTQEQIEARLEQYRQERAAFVEQANRQITLYDGAIAALTALLAGDEPAAGEDEQERE